MAKIKLDVRDFVQEQDIDEYLNNLYLGMGDVRKIKVQNQMLKEDWYDNNQTPMLVAEMCRNPMYLHFFAKYICNVDILPYQGAMLHMLWNKLLCLLIGSRGMAKSFMMAVYCIMRLVLHQGCKVVVIGAGLRQSMVVWEYINVIWSKSPILQDIVGYKSHPKKDLHAAYWEVGDSRATFLPLGTGDKIRGARATHIIAEEFASIPPDIFETVVRGFAAVRSDGVLGNVVQAYKEEEMKKYGMHGDMKRQDELPTISLPTILPGNQIVLAGTANFQFNHFYKYYQYYRAVIMTGGDKNQLKQMFPEREIKEDISAANYAIIRVPANHLPKGLMDENILQQGKATMDASIFKMEYMACFPADSEGFYLASSIYKCTCPVKNGEAADIVFGPQVIGSSDKWYFMGVDPASESDRFAVNIIEGNEFIGHVVYQWSTNRKEFEKMRTNGQLKAEINDYNTFCIYHILSLCRRFNIHSICLDAGGGGLSIREGLRDTSKLKNGEEPIIDVESSMNEGGRRILHMIQFVKDEWRRDSHWGLKKDFENRHLLFPYYDGASVEVATHKDKESECTYDGLEEVSNEIEQCKVETTFIKYEQTQQGHEKWGLSGLKMNNQNLHRDRFTSLLLANWGRRMYLEKNRPSTAGDVNALYGGVARNMPKNIIVGIETFTPTGTGRKIYY